MEAIIKSSSAKFRDIALLLSRLIVASVFIFAGYAKWIFWYAIPSGVPVILVGLFKLLSIVEPVAALALIFGFLTRWASGGLAVIMIGAIIVLRLTMQTPFFTSPQGLGFDYNLLILGNCLMLMAFGAGRWSADQAVATYKNSFQNKE